MIKKCQSCLKFEQIDLDCNGFIDKNKFHELLKMAHLHLYIDGEEISSKRYEK